MSKRYIAIVGATASGKSSLALRLAKKYKGELINCDSIQIYKGFDIGSAKPSWAEQSLVQHHLWDRASWQDSYDARIYAEEARNYISNIESRGKLPIVVGGTGLYLRALWREGWHDLPKDENLRLKLDQLSHEQLKAELDRLDPKRSQEIHANDRFRLQRAVEIARLLGHSIKDLGQTLSQQDQAFVIKLGCPRAELQEKITLRTKLMLAQGLLDEVKGLLAEGVDPDSKPMQSIGYKQCVQLLNQEIPESQLEMAIIIATRQYAKRQDTWFRKVQADFQWQGEASEPALLFQLSQHFAACGPSSL